MEVLGMASQSRTQDSRRDHSYIQVRPSLPQLAWEYWVWLRSHVLRILGGVFIFRCGLHSLGWHGSTGYGFAVMYSGFSAGSFLYLGAAFTPSANMGVLGMVPLRFDVPKNHGFRSNLYTIPFDFDSNGPVSERKISSGALKIELS